MHQRLSTALTISGFAALVALAACSGAATAAPESAPASVNERATLPKGLSRAVFAGGCFWCMEPPFEKLEGVHAVISGYTGGPEKNPTYRQVSSGRTGHTEAVEIHFDPKKITYARLLEVFWHNIDPTVRNRQFCDAGTQYRTAIFAIGAEQRKLAEASLAQVKKTKTFSGDIVTPIHDAGPFYDAEGYHQDFYKKSPARYYGYRRGCGRDARLKTLWGKDAGH